jgi:basic membrane protein A and related proteins
MFMRIVGTLALAATALACASAVQAAEVKVAYIPCGNVNDKSWSENGYEGLLDAQKTLAASGTKMQLDYTESQPASKVEAAARDYASRGYDIIDLHCGTFADAALNVARAFPKTKVIYVTAPPDTNWPPNFWYYDIAQQEGQFAAGALAALTTRRGRVAAIASFDFPAMSRQVEGFILGARYANPNIKYSRTYIGTWDDAAKAKEATLAAVDAGADVILADTDQAARGAFSAAEANNVYVVATYADQSGLAPHAILGSVLYDYGALEKQMVLNAVAGKLEKGKAYYMGMADGFGGWAPNPAMKTVIPAQAQAKLDEVLADIKSRRIKVPELTKPGDADKFDVTTLKK